MKNYLFLLVMLALVIGVSSCKKDSLDALREYEVVTLNKYIEDNNLAAYKDSTGIYFKKLVENPDATAKKIASKYQTEIYFNISLINPEDTVFTTEDGLGHNYETFTFVVDESSSTSGSSYVQQISGLHIGLKKMKVGEKAFMVIPSELAFKAMDYNSIGIPRFSTLLATVEVKSALSPEELNEESK